MLGTGFRTRKSCFLFAKPRESSPVWEPIDTILKPTPLPICSESRFLEFLHWLQGFSATPAGGQVSHTQFRRLRRPLPPTKRSCGITIFGRKKVISLRDGHKMRRGSSDNDLCRPPEAGHLQTETPTLFAQQCFRYSLLRPASWEMLLRQANDIKNSFGIKNSVNKL